MYSINIPKPAGKKTIVFWTQDHDISLISPRKFIDSSSSQTLSMQKFRRDPSITLLIYRGHIKHHLLQIRPAASAAKVMTVCSNIKPDLNSVCTAEAPNTSFVSLITAPQLPPSTPQPDTSVAVNTVSSSNNIP